MDQLINTLLDRISRLNTGRTSIILAIDGRCAAGKTTFASELQKKTGCCVIHMDDFFLRPQQRTPQRLAQAGGNIDYERVLSEALIPLRKNETACYRPYDCHTQSFKQPIIVLPQPLIVFEGSYSCHPKLFSLYDYHIFITLNPDEQLRRIEKRNGPQALSVFKDKWIPLEEKYFAQCRIEENCQWSFKLSIPSI